MYVYDSTARIATDFGKWYALVTLKKDGVPTSHFLTFDTQPTSEQVKNAAEAFALQKNIAEAPVMASTQSISRETFFGRFTNTEIAAIYRASASNDTLFAYVKKLEINPTVNIANAEVIAGLALLEKAGLLAVGRSADILKPVIAVATSRDPRYNGRP